WHIRSHRPTAVLRRESDHTSRVTLVPRREPNQAGIARLHIRLRRMLALRPLLLILAGTIALAGCAANTAKPPYGGVPDSAELVPPAPEGDASGSQLAPRPDGRAGGDFAPHSPQADSAAAQPAPSGQAGPA